MAALQGCEYSGSIQVNPVLGGIVRHFILRWIGLVTGVGRT